MSAERMCFKPVDLLREETAHNLTPKVRTRPGTLMKYSKLVSLVHLEIHVLFLLLRVLPVMKII